MGTYQVRFRQPDSKENTTDDKELSLSPIQSYHYTHVVNARYSEEEIRFLCLPTMFRTMEYTENSLSSKYSTTLYVLKPSDETTEISTNVVEKKVE